MLKPCADNWRLPGVLLLAIVLAGCGTLPSGAPPVDAPPAGEPEGVTAPGDGSAVIAEPPLDPALVTRFEGALAALRAGEAANAVTLLEAIVAADAALVGAQVNLGIARLESGDEDGARSAFDAALELQPDHPLVLNRLAVLERRAGRFGEARELYKRALAAQPDYAPAHLNLGILCDLYLLNGACALSHYQRYVALGGSEVERVNLWIVDLEQRLGTVVSEND